MQRNPEELDEPRGQDQDQGDHDQGKTGRGRLGPRRAASRERQDVREQVDAQGDRPEQGIAARSVVM